MIEKGRRGICPVCGHEALWFGKFEMGKWGPRSRPWFECANDPELWHKQIDGLRGKMILGVVRNESLWSEMKSLQCLIDDKKRAAANPMHPQTYREAQEGEVPALKQKLDALVAQVRTILKTHGHKEGFLRNKGLSWVNYWFLGIEA